MKNFFYTLEVNLENQHVRSVLDQSGFLTPDVSELAVNSRFFLDSQACFTALNEDLNVKVDLFKVRQVKDGVVTSLQESNPIVTNSKEDLEKFAAENPGFVEYLKTWDEQELLRLTFTTEEFEEDEPPIINDESALMFKYTMHVLEDDMELPESARYNLVEPSSTIH